MEVFYNILGRIVCQRILDVLKEVRNMEEEEFKRIANDAKPELAGLLAVIRYADF